MGVPHVTPPTTECGLEVLAATTCHPLSPSHSSPSTSNIATIGTPSNDAIERVEPATVSGDADTNDSLALDFPISFSQDPSSDFQVNETLNLSDILNVELESGWNSWLMDDNFDLDALNSSLLQATTGDFMTVDRMPDEGPLATGSFSVDQQATNAALAPSGDEITEKWHTYCGQATSGVISPDPANDCNQIDESYRHELAKRLQQRLQAGILPSTTFLVRSTTFILCVPSPGLRKWYKGGRREILRN
ncbi:hypothetical protein N7499_005638 [Penicillium canescens]|uniref:Uncharacterized protein n=1 Tax=Penicillium canescens TaxID=5083 RepID=A0AAD6N8U5_PENCN|nr:uncharacterized protein N7446_001407 [Penicillium canescens]KAJ5997967.1 hypothetical protein N7522_009627 [Penicillium canescens]KAJ6043212.1 hypothetical protein N7460_004567 [Penicillium canescens]KAJ6073630.1 hypothetical protein N7446_001407 [Penicillium canescens]KAJ6080764.1 hypothetical protein N7499_005638 [Penicillium canescens]